MIRVLILDEIVVRWERCAPGPRRRDDDDDDANRESFGSSLSLSLLSSQQSAQTRKTASRLAMESINIRKSSKSDIQKRGAWGNHQDDANRW